MKRFQFSLDKLKSYKEQVLQSEKNELAFLRSQKAKLEEEKAEAEEKLRGSNLEFCEKSAKGLNVREIAVFKGYHKSLSELIEELEALIEKAEEKVAAQLQTVIEATKEVSSLEKLEEKQLEEYNFTAAKAEEKFIAEFVQYNSFISEKA